MLLDLTKPANPQMTRPELGGGKPCRGVSYHVLSRSGFNRDDTKIIIMQIVCHTLRGPHTDLVEIRSDLRLGEFPALLDQDNKGQDAIQNLDCSEGDKESISVGILRVSP